MNIDIRFPGNMKVEAIYDGFTVCTDQKKSEGGDESAPKPFSLFLASLGTCAGVTVLAFCQERNISTEGLRLSISFEWNEQTHHMDTIHTAIHLPKDFPEKYVQAIQRAADLCKVKQHVLHPPAFEISTRPYDPSAMV